MLRSFNDEQSDINEESYDKLRHKIVEDFTMRANRGQNDERFPSAQIEMRAKRLSLTMFTIDEESGRASIETFSKSLINSANRRNINKYSISRDSVLPPTVMSIEAET